MIIFLSKGFPGNGFKEEGGRVNTLAFTLVPSPSSTINPGGKVFQTYITNLCESQIKQIPG